MIVHVALPIPVRKAFSYLVPGEWVPLVELFLRVKVPFRNKTRLGFIVGVEEGDRGDCKEIHEIMDPFPLLDENIVHLARWASHYYIAPEGLILRYALPAGLLFDKHLRIQAHQGIDPLGLEGLTLKKACEEVGRDVIFGLYRKGSLRFCDVLTKGFFEKANHNNCGGGVEKTLFLGRINDRLNHYTDIIARHVANDDNVLMLVPDHLGVGQFFFHRLSQQFPGKILRYGSSVTPRKRMEAYLRARKKGGFLILGSKSALFLPVFRNGHIIVERPEEDEYRNEEGFRFNSVEIAIKRAEIEGVPIVLGSVSPPLDLYKSAREGELGIIEKVFPRPEEYTEIITEKGVAAQGGFPQELMTLVSGAVENRETIAIYTPRKDYSSHIKCLDCKSLFRCPVCGGGLSYRKQDDVLSCTECGRTLSYNDRCRECGSRLIQFTNVGVEYLEQKLKDALPGVSIIRVTGDTFRENKDPFKGCCPGEPVIAIGTQALSKPYGIKAQKLIMVEWEGLMRVGGYRAREKMFHILSNLVDVLEPEKLYLFMTRKKRVNVKEFFDVASFCTAELEKRKSAQFPPFVRLFLLEVEREDEMSGMRIIAKVTLTAKKHQILQHITGPLMQKRRKYRWRMILKGSEDKVYDFLAAVSDFHGVSIEVDPLNI